MNAFQIFELRSSEIGEKLFLSIKVIAQSFLAFSFFFSPNRTVDKFLLGSKDLLTFEVLVANGGEDAFETSFYMTIPPSVKYKNLKPIGDAPDTPITCTAPTEETHLLKCDLGNPFPSGKAVRFEVALNPTYSSNMDPSYDFYIEVNSTNPEREGSNYDNIIRKNVGIWLETDLKISG